MEEKPQPKQPEDTTPQMLPYGSDFLDNWLFHKDNKESDKAIDDDGESRPSVFTRFRRPFKSLFSKFMRIGSDKVQDVKEHKESTPTDRPEDRTFYNPDLTESATPQPPKAENTTAEGENTISRAESETSEVTSEPEREQLEELSKEPEEGGADKPPPQPPLPERPPEQPKEPLDPHEQVVYERNPQPQPVQIEQYYERDSAGVAAAVVIGGAEYIGRKRAVHKANKKVKKLERKVKVSQEKIEELNQKAQNSRDQLLAIQKKQQAFEARPLPTPKPEVIPAIKEQYLEHRPEPVPTLSVQPESIKIPLKQTKEQYEPPPQQSQPSEKVPLTPRVVEAVIQSAPEKKQASEEFIKHVAESVKESLATELLYERRQEIKDVPGQRQTGTDFSFLTSQSNLPSGKNALFSQPAQLPISSEQRREPRSRYKRVATRGVWVLAIVIILYLLALAIR